MLATSTAMEWAEAFVYIVRETWKLGVVPMLIVGVFGAVWKHGWPWRPAPK